MLPKRGRSESVADLSGLGATAAHCHTNSAETDDHHRPGRRLRNRADCDLADLERIKGAIRTASSNRPELAGFTSRSNGAKRTQNRGA